jgi:hypothetical protein
MIGDTLKNISSMAFCLTLGIKRTNLVGNIAQPNYSFTWITNGRKVTDAISKAKLECLPRPYSLDLNPCDFWLFRMLKHNMRDQPFHAVEGRDSGLGRHNIQTPPMSLQRLDGISSFGH